MDWHADSVTAIGEAVTRAGSQRLLAKAIGRAQQHISFLVQGAYSVSAEDAIAIERETGVDRWRLRPDLWTPPAAAPASDVLPADEAAP